MESTNIVPALDTRTKRKDGTYPLIFRLGHNRHTAPIPLKVYLKKSEWDEEKRVVKECYKGTESVKLLNNRIQAQKVKLLAELEEMDKRGELESLSVLDIKRLLIKSSGDSFYAFAAEQIEALIKAKRIGTARSYRVAVNVLKLIIMASLSL
jgi:hypothetical protein